MPFVVVLGFRHIVGELDRVYWALQDSNMCMGSGHQFPDPFLVFGVL
jgi:hypothetical protein